MRRSVLSPALALGLDLDLLQDDLFLSPHFQLGPSASRLIGQLDKSSHWRQLLLFCMLFARQLRPTSGDVSQRLRDSHISVCSCSTAAGRHMFDSVHVHMLLHELNLHCWDLHDDLPSPISGTTSMLTLGFPLSALSAGTFGYSLSLRSGCCRTLCTFTCFYTNCISTLSESA